MLKRSLIIGFLVVAGGVGVATAQENNGGLTPAPSVANSESADQGNAPIGAPNAYGVQNYSAYVVSPAAFHPYKDALGYVLYSSGYVGAQSGDSFRWFIAPVELPTGALLRNTVVHVMDSTSTGHIHVLFGMDECSGTAGCSPTYLVDVYTTDAETPGYKIFNDSGSSGFTWRNFDQDANTINYGSARVYFSTGTSYLALGPIMIWYQRQISPAPATATFPDVPKDYWAFQYVEALAASGITQGMPDGNFHPRDPVTRAQMATFLSRALGLDYPDFKY